VAAIPLMIFSIASMAEATGQTVVNAEIVGKEIDIKRSASRTIRGDGLTSLVGGLFGTPLMVTSGENIGIVRVSGVRSRFVTLTAGVILIVVGIVAPIGRIISVIPAPVVGGTALVVYAIVMALGIQLLRKVDFPQRSNMVIAAVAFAVGLLPILIPGFYGAVRGPRAGGRPRFALRRRGGRRGGGSGPMTIFDHSRLDQDELLLEPEWVLLPDGATRHHAVLVRHGVFAEVGPREVVGSRHPDLAPLRLDETLLMPGLVDTHHHRTQSFGKALVFGEPSEIFRRVWVPLEAGLDGEGMAADYLLVDLAVPEMLPSWDLEWELVRLANRDQILAVVVGGRPPLWRGWPVDWDARQLLEKARRRARKVVADAPVHIVHPTAGEHRRASRAGRRTKAPA
jgi:hypothetical protein